MKILLDWREIKTFDDFFESFLPQVKAPSWHGKNMNALRDSIIVGDINGVEPPFSVININLSELQENAREVYEAVTEVFDEATKEGRVVSICNEQSEI